MQIKQAQTQSVNGQPVQPKPTLTNLNKRPMRGRDIADAAIRLRVYLGKELRRQCEEAGLDAEHWGPSAVTALTIGLERIGLRGIPDDQCDVVA